MYTHTHFLFTSPPPWNHKNTIYFFDILENTHSSPPPFPLTSQGAPCAKFIISAVNPQECKTKFHVKVPIYIYIYICTHTHTHTYIELYIYIYIALYIYCPVRLSSPSPPWHPIECKPKIHFKIGTLERAKPRFIERLTPNRVQNQRLTP